MAVWIFAALIFAVDQLTKALVKMHMAPNQSIPVIDNILHLTYVQNTGAAFSLLKGRVFFFVVVSFAVIAVIVYYLTRLPEEKKLFKFTLALVLGGAFGNLVDRLRFGYVVDFIDFRIWPVFNVADSAVVIGVLLLLYLVMCDSEILKSLD
ncbi:signal peptidase II . Aspartic peptidase. MEROPS family A08 [Caldanaerovirga acetigignens]|uniref:Lipoprotein signal peptidase n=1 Tax=Caldanaerovirga acetigignens TaxID=447595 RepID=A0A1M7FVR2_9FIRM|nr:signal peptidase II [Caldanaerovirga acetigignens]SHM07995.1 signal peptidase II . Aspartic peptidase. MEROPS family A08 [Caldanaerovirga acetigignens]